MDTQLLKRILLERKSNIKSSIDSIKERSFSEGTKLVLSEDSTADQHFADLGTETFERSKDLGLKDGLEADLIKVRQALKRIENGTYGLCAVCGQPIPEQRLKALPEAELCMSCQEDQETATRPPTEDQ